ncbi:hypothetical protein [Desulfosediminicola flagellatus]|uniref:hypothetical protein n=1 Tax=Desulfosediminicola flagellatus TaxID=2569541 RepID=UPI0010AD36CF|nr:hypothetical protein [Desulfosediminicola flagellatus]
MSNTENTNVTAKKTCEGCGGSGQISFFRGVSRFVMDWDDCPDCLGTGYVQEPDDQPTSTDTPDDRQ